MNITERAIMIATKKDITSYQLCKEIGLAHTTLSTWKSRGTNPPSNLIKPMADFLGVSTSYLLTGEEDSTEKLIKSEKELLEIFRRMTPNAKKHLLNSANEIYKMSTELTM